MKTYQFGSVFAIIAAAAILLSGCGGSGSAATGSTGGPPPPGTSPTVTATAPARGDSSAPLSARITATFSRAMDPSSLNTASFRASAGAVPLNGTVTCVGNTATLKLSAPMAPNTAITGEITDAVKDAEGNHLTHPYTWQFTTGSSTDSTPPTVSSTDPKDMATGVAVNKRVQIAFSEPMDAATINTSTIAIRGPASSVIPATVTLLNNVATLDPTDLLKANTVYTATVTTGVHDLSDNAMAADKVWSFKTGTNSDTTVPTVTSTDPRHGDTGVPVNKRVSATFSDNMDVKTINSDSFTLRNAAGNDVSATVEYASKTAVFNPAQPLAPNSVYTAKLASTITDASGNALAKAKSWSFTTAGGGDTTAPTVVSTNPADGATNFFLNRSVNATFSEKMDPSTINSGSFTVSGTLGSVTYNAVSHIATFKPSADLLADTTYTASLSVAVKDSNGNRLAMPYVWTFRTGNQRAQTNINLGAATSYAVLAGSTVTNAGPTVLNGDMGVSPGTAITGFPPGRVNGAIHAGDAQAAKAKEDLLKGQLEAAGLLGGQTLPGDLSGLTFTPGLYKNSTSVMLSAGKVTLDAQGDPDAVFIFQMGSTLTTSPGTKVILAGGARAENIYWSVGTSATLGVNSTFKGIVLAEVSITVNNGATNDGTFLTKIGAVTLEANTVTRSPRNRG